MLLQHYEGHGEAFLSRSLTKDEIWFFHCTPQKNKTKSMTLLVQKKFKAVQSPRKVVATVFCDVYCVLLIGFTPLSSTITAAAYRETKEIQGDCLAIETRILCAIILDFTVLPQL
jgi:hypothetical protein